MDFKELEERMTEKQKKFCDYYIETGNASEASLLAGYSEKTARNIASENLTKPYLRDYIKAKVALKDKKRIASQDEVLEFLTSVLRGEVSEEVIAFDLKGLTLRDTKQVSPKERLKAGEMLARRYGLDRPDITNEEDDKNITINITVNDED